MLWKEVKRASEVAVEAVKVRFSDRSSYFRKMDILCMQRK